MAAIPWKNARQKWSKLATAHQGDACGRPARVPIGSAALEHQHPHCFICHQQTFCRAAFTRVVRLSVWIY
jgi:hypothetical protein